MQPGAVKHRKLKNGSKGALKKGYSIAMCSHLLPFKTSAQKRVHNFSENMKANKPVVKKAGRSMNSKNKYLLAIKEVHIIAAEKRPMIRISLHFFSVHCFSKKVAIAFKTKSKEKE